MRVSTLIKILEDLDPDMEVRLATQPNWPFECGIAEVTVLELEGEEAEQAGTPGIVYIAEGKQIGYLAGEVRNNLGW